MLYAGASAWLGWSTGSREEIWPASYSAYTLVSDSDSSCNDPRFAHGFSFWVSFWVGSSLEFGGQRSLQNIFFPRKGDGRANIVHDGQTDGGGILH
jgi:hypothetical protein